jgi:threonine/homoserine/homoserine lactone efflux protein
MGEAFAEALALALAIAVSPPPIIAVVSLLTTPRARANTMGFLAGWILGLWTVGAVMLLLGDALEGETTPTWRSALKVILGGALLTLGAKSALTAVKGGEKATPGWMSRLDEMGPRQAAVLGLLLTTVNPKNLLLAVTAAGLIVEAGGPAAAQAGAYLLFSVVASIGVTVPFVVYLTMGTRAPEILARFKGWMARHSATIMAAVLGLLGGLLFSQGLAGLLG